MRVDQTMFGQDFAIGFRATVAATLHQFNQANGNALQPRVIRKMERLNILPSTQPLQNRGLLQRLSVSGWNLLLSPGPGTTQNVLAGSARPGFPGRALDPLAMVDLSNLIACYAGPNSPVELSYAWSQAEELEGFIGTDLPDPSLVDQVVAAINEGDVYGEPNFALGGGEVQQLNANTAETISVAYKSPREMRLERMICDTFRSNGAPVVRGDVTVSAIRISGTPLFSTSNGVDAQMLSPFCTDEDGLQLGVTVETDDLIEIDFSVLAAGAGVSFIVQHGFFTS